ncbi:hypothetical protein RZS08_26560, partial [Arthrospira platensis SPKY1]|nr:hypothetical protein [Arthrospira platensis SPKY1]
LAPGEHRRGATRHRGVVGKDVGDACIGLAAARPHAGRVALRILEARGGRAKGELRPLRHQRHLAAQLARQPAVVGVQEGEVASARRADAGVARAAHAPVGLGDDADRVAIAGEHAGGVVGAAVIDDHDLAIGEVLRQHAVDRSPDTPGGVVCGNDDADRRLSTR